MSVALGKMSLAPGDFWGMSPREFHAATKGFREFHCGTSGQGVDHDDLPSQDDLAAMMAEFPDGTMEEHVAHLAKRRGARG